MGWWEKSSKRKVFSLRLFGSYLELTGVWFRGFGHVKSPQAIDSSHCCNATTVLYFMLVQPVWKAYLSLRLKSFFFGSGGGVWEHILNVLAGGELHNTNRNPHFDYWSLGSRVNTHPRVLVGFIYRKISEVKTSAASIRNAGDACRTTAVARRCLVLGVAGKLTREQVCNRLVCVKLQSWVIQPFVQRVSRSSRLATLETSRRCCACNTIFHSLILTPLKPTR